LRRIKLRPGTGSYARGGEVAFGRGGRQVGQMLRPHGMSIDNQGNLYVGEASTGRRVQKFTLQRPGSR